MSARGREDLVGVISMRASADDGHLLPRRCSALAARAGLRGASLRGRLSLAIVLGGLAALALSPAALASGGEPREVQYGASPLEIANVYPSSTSGSPVVVLVHGGGWRQQRDLSRLELSSRALQAEGFTVYEIDYEQDSSETPAFPLEPDDVIAATRWAIAHAAAYNGNPGDVTLLGGSAGGNLAALAVEQLDEESPGAVEGVVLLSAPTNLVALAPMLGEQITYQPFVGAFHWALDWEQGEPFPEAYAARWSPALHAPSHNCPSWLIFNGETELIPLSQAQEMQDSLTHAGCQSTLEVVPGGEHAFAYFHRVKPEIFSFIRGQ